jgi:hypothetical protein
MPSLSKLPLGLGGLSRPCQRVPDDEQREHHFYDSQIEVEVARVVKNLKPIERVRIPIS